MKHIESQHGVALIEWHNLNLSRLSGLDLLFHVPMGGKREKQTRRDKRTGKMVTFSPEGVRMKREGVKKGVPDYWLPVPILINQMLHAGLVFELKSPLEYPTAEQRWWFERLSDVGWFCFCAWDWQHAATVIEHYLLGRLNCSDHDAQGWLRINGTRMVKIYN